MFSYIDYFTDRPTIVLRQENYHNRSHHSSKGTVQSHSNTRHILDPNSLSSSLRTFPHSGGLSITCSPLTMLPTNNGMIKDTVKSIKKIIPAA